MRYLEPGNVRIGCALWALLLAVGMLVMLWS